MNTPSHEHPPIALVVGASRGLGLAITTEYLERGYLVVATVRGQARTRLHDLAASWGSRLRIESLDVTAPTQIADLHGRLSIALEGRRLALLFVVAGISLAAQEEAAADMPDDDFARTMLTNALAPLRVIERLDDLVAADGTIAVMSSGQGSISRNQTGGFEAYRASKAALNQLMRSYAARHDADRRPLLLLAPGWVQTGMGGSAAPLTIAESIPALVATVEAQRGTRGLRYLDRHGDPIPW